MTTIRSAAPLTSAAIPVATLSSARTDSTPESSAVSLAPTRSGRSSLGSVQDLASDPIASRNARAEAARAVHSALGGDPTALLAMVTLRMRDSKTTNRLADASANAATARDALADERAARATAAEAARKAAEATNTGDIFSIIAKVTAVVVGIAVTVCSGGAGAVVLAGALMLAFGDLLVEGLVEAGIVPPQMAESLALALKVTGSLMMGPSALVGALSIAGSVIATYGNDLVDALLDAGVDADFCEKLGIGLGVAGAGLSLAGGCAGSSSSAAAEGVLKTATQVVKATGDVVVGAATIGGAAMEIVSADHIHDAELSQADATDHRADADMANEEIGTITDAIRDDFKRAAKMLRLARQIGEAHQQSMQAASGARA